MDGAWASASKQYEYFKNTDNGYSNGVITLNSPDDIANAIKSGVQIGDIAFMDYNGDGTSDYTIIITKIDEKKNNKLWCTYQAKSFYAFR